MNALRRMLWIGLAGVVCASTRAAEVKLDASVDPRVELMSIIFRLAGNPEYNQPRSQSPYAEAVAAHFGPFREHAVVQTAARLRRERGVSFDAVMSMAMHIQDTDGFAERVPFDRAPPRLDKRWRVEDARVFLREARDFARQSGFSGFFRAHRALYKEAARRMRDTLSRRGYLAWFDKFFGARPQARFHVYIGMLNGGCCYGSGIQFPGGAEEICPVIGAWTFDADGVPTFGEGIAGTVVHELCHSYTNAYVNKHEAALRPAGEAMFRHCAERMKQMAYGTWQTMMYESLVRACVVRYLDDTDGPAAARKEIARQRGKGFEWVGDLSAVLAKYEADRQRYPTFDDYMPQVVAFFDAYAESYGEWKSRAREDAPKVVSMTPANGARDVDPKLAEIVIAFDRPMMDRMWSVVGGGQNFPEITGEVHYDKTRRLFTMPVKLKPNWSYTFWLNSADYDAFRSAEGVPLESVKVTFTTRGT
jgi:hypothetical protein